MIYFVTVGHKDEVEVIKEVKPPRLLLSYFYFKNKPIKEFLDKLEYQPEILLDSGAYSAWTKGKNISIIDYMDYITENNEYIKNYIALDVIGDDELTKRYYDIMIIKGFDPVPVFHEGDDLSYLHYYVDSDAPFIALGGTAKERSKLLVRDWVQDLQNQFPNQPFHLLGSSSQQIIKQTNLRSFDSSTWIMMAANNKAKHLKSKKEQMKYFMNKIMEENQ